MSLKDEFLGLLEKVDQLEAKCVQLESLQQSSGVVFSEAQANEMVSNALLNLKSSLLLKVQELNDLLK